KFRVLSIDQRFEHFVVMFLPALIVVIVAAALWTLALKILFGLVLSGGLDPSDYSTRRPDGRRYRLFVDEDRQFLERAKAGSGQYDVTGRIVQLEVAERDRDQVAAKAGDIADGQDGVDVALLAEYEIFDAPDHVFFVVDDELQLDGLSAVASSDLRRFQGRQGDFLRRGTIHPRKSDDRNDDHGGRPPVHDIPRRSNVIALLVWRIARAVWLTDLDRHWGPRWR
ncbi:MAG: hypothetical protein ABWY14_00240, partial [Tardiphaga sp.]